MPRPSQAGQAPKGLLNENRRGSISSMVKPETGQANLAEKVVRSPVLAPVLAPLLAFPDFASSAKARPSARWSAVSKLSARRELGRAHVRTPVPNAHPACRPLLETTNNPQHT